MPGPLTPRRHASLARPARANERGLLAGWARRETRLRSGLRSSNQNPLGNCVGAQVETSCGPDSARARFLIAARRSAPGSCELTGHDSGSEELVICAFQSADAVARGGRHQLPPTFPRLPGIIPVALSAGFSGRRTATVLSRNGGERAGPRGKRKPLFFTFGSQ